jgi:hypothetical protein
MRISRMAVESSSEGLPAMGVKCVADGRKVCGRFGEKCCYLLRCHRRLRFPGGEGALLCWRASACNGGLCGGLSGGL